MRLSHDQAIALGTHLGGLYGATVLTHDSPGVVLALGLFDAATALVPAVAPVVTALRAPLDRVSLTFPAPAGTVVVLSPAAVATPESYAEVVAHECEHARQIAQVGGTQTAVDYLGSGELRATREAQAYVVGLWVRFLVTGELPTVESAMSSLTSGLYHLDAEDIELARGVVTSGVETIREGSCPPYEVAAVALLWLRVHAADVLPVAWQVRS